MGTGNDEASDLDGEDPESIFQAETELNEEGFAAWTEAEEECQHAMAAMQQARRTLRVARERQKMVKLNRQYYKGSSSNRNSDPKRDEKITCLRCGQTGHRAASCPAPHPKENTKSAEMAPFVRYTSVPDEMPGVEATWDGSPCVCFTSAPDVEQALQIGVSTVNSVSTPEAVSMGKAIIDCGATKSLGSVYALERVMQLSSNGVGHVDVYDKPVFGFGNSSEDQCVSTLHLNLRAGGRPGQLKVHALDMGSAPILFSIASLRALGATIDFSECTMVLKNVDRNRLLHLEQSRTGHLLLPLTGDLLEKSVATHSPVPLLSSYVQSVSSGSSEAGNTPE